MIFYPSAQRPTSPELADCRESQKGARQAAAKQPGRQTLATTCTFSPHTNQLYVSSNSNPVDNKLTTTFVIVPARNYPRFREGLIFNGRYAVLEILC